MTTAKLSMFISAAVVALSLPAWAGELGTTVDEASSQESPWTALAWKIHHKRVHHYRALAAVGRAWETFLHSPQILSETIEGDRALVNTRGVLAPREIPSEDRIFSPDE